MLQGIRADLAEELLRLGCVRFGQFRLKLHERNPDAPLSPIYLDLRSIRSFPALVDLAVEVYKDLSRGLEFDRYADVPTGVTPIVAVLSHNTRVPMISPRLDAKSHGLTRRVDGHFEAGQVVLLIDDLITQADSKFEAISVLEGSGLVVRDVLVLVDREQGGAAELTQRGYSCRAALTLRGMLEAYLSASRISPDDYSRTLDYLGLGNG